MREYVIRNLLLFIPTLLGASILIFVLLRMVPGEDRAMVTVDPGDLFALVFTTGTGSNWGRWSDPKVDELTERGLKEQNRDKRRDIYRELQRHLLTQDTTAVAVGWVEGFHFRDKKVRNYKFAPTIYDNNTFMKVWLAP